jgi:hypothetical protein
MRGSTGYLGRDFSIEADPEPVVEAHPVDLAGVHHASLPPNQYLERPTEVGSYPTTPILGFEVEDVEAAREELIERGVEFLTEALEFEEGASSAKFRAPNGQVYELWRPEERYRMGNQ